jgi:glycosyltransferase involved in cell wall biosynthesis
MPPAWQESVSLQQLPLVSVAIPARNEEATLGRVLDELHAVIAGQPDYRFEIIVIDNNSSDRTSTVGLEHGARVVPEPRPGKGMALAAGFREAQGEIIIMMDADYSHIAGEIPLFLQKINAGYGLVIGSRRLGGSDEYTPVRRFGNLFLTGCFRLVFGYYLTDALNGFKAFRSDIVKKHHCRSQDFEIEIELIYYALLEKFRVGEIVSHERERAGGMMKSQACIHGPKFLAAILKYGSRYRLSK